MPETVARRVAEVAIFQGPDLAAIEEARAAYSRADSARRMAELADAGSRRLSDPMPDADATAKALAAAEAYDAAVAEALPRAVMAQVTALGRKTYRRLLSEHPPREGNEADDQLGFNEDTFLDAVLEHWDGETGERTLTFPKFDSKNEAVAWLDVLSDGMFIELASAAVRINQGGSPDPKVSLGSQAAQMYAATSRSHDSTD